MSCKSYFKIHNVSHSKIESHFRYEAAQSIGKLVCSLWLQNIFTEIPNDTEEGYKKSCRSHFISNGSKCRWTKKMIHSNNHDPIVRGTIKEEKEEH